MIICTDYISRQAAIIGLAASSLTGGQIEDAAEAIELVPAADVRPVVRGKWIDIMVGEMPAQACDQCKTFFPLAYTNGGHSFCPHCGADMGKEKKR